MCDSVLIILGLIVAIWFFHKYMQGGVCTIRKNLNGKIVFITGANTGIGKEAALQLGNMGATVIIACRDTIKG